MRFAGDLAFPNALKALEADELGIAVICCFARRGDISHTAPEVAARLLLWASDQIRPEEYAPYEEFEDIPDTEDGLDGVPVTNGTPQASYVAALASAIAVMAIAKPFVSVVTASVSAMGKNLARDLHLRPEHLAPRAFASVFQGYLSRMDLAAIARMLADRQFPGSTWLTTYAARHGAGTSHIVAICTFLQLYPRCPFLKYVPLNEYENFFEALKCLQQDSMVLFPVTGVVNLHLDRLRATAMPSLLIAAVFGLTAHGDTNWRRYHNLPYHNNIGGLSASYFISAITRWVVAVNSTADLEQDVKDGFDFRELLSDFDSEIMAPYVQQGGKIKSFYQKS